MDDLSLVKLATEGGISVLLSVIVLLWLRNDAKERIAQAEARAAQDCVAAEARTAAADARADQERADKVLIVGVVQENTKAVTHLSGLISQAFEPRR